MGREGRGHLFSPPLIAVITRRMQRQVGLGLGGRCRQAWETPAGSSELPPLRAAAETEASHMCKMHLVKINVGFVFSIKTETKTQELLLK